MMKYDKYLGKLFDEKINNNTSYTGGASETGSTFLHSCIECFYRVATNFWYLVYLLFFYISGYYCSTVRNEKECAIM